MTHTEYMAFLDEWIFYQFPRFDDNWLNPDILREVSRTVADTDKVSPWARRDCWSMYVSSSK